jgi:hypothetical protein
LHYFLRATVKRSPWSITIIANYSYFGRNVVGPLQPLKVGDAWSRNVTPHVWTFCPFNQKGCMYTPED